MKPLEINLATRPFRNNTLYWAGFGGAALVLTLLSGANLWLFLGYGSAMQQYDQDLALKRQRRDHLTREENRLSVKVSQLDFKGLAGRGEFANAAIRRRVFSWTELFNRLEEVVPPSVMMTAIRPEIQAEGISVAVEGIAKDHEGLLTFEENLIHSAYFSRIYPGSERREQRQRELRFSIRFEYNPAGRPGVAPTVVADKQEPKPAATSAGTDSSGPASEPAPAPQEVPHPAPAPIAAAGPATPPQPVPQPVQPPATALLSPQAASPGASGTISAGTPGAAPVGNTQPQAAPPAAPPPAPAGASPAGDTRTVAPPPQRAGPRPPLRPGAMMGRTGPMGPGPGGRVGGGPAAARRAQEEAAAAAARFVSTPVQDVLDYLMKERKWTFIFLGSLEVRKQVTMDLNTMEDEEILLRISEALECVIGREPNHVYRLAPRSMGELLEDPPVEEEQAPPEETAPEPPPEEPPPPEKPEEPKDEKP